jgi:hypothetical protein
MNRLLAILLAVALAAAAACAPPPAPEPRPTPPRRGISAMSGGEVGLGTAMGGELGGMASDIYRQRDILDRDPRPVRP